MGNCPAANKTPLPQTREEAFTQQVFADYAALHPRAEALLDSLLRRIDIRRLRVRSIAPCPLPGGIEIRNIGRQAGQCTRGGTVVVNSQLIDYPGEVRATIAHELAHAVVETARRRLLQAFGTRRRRGMPGDIARRRGEWSTHGATWRSVARQLGDGGERCHHLPLKPLRRLRRFLYRADCGAELVLSSVRHNRLQRNRRLEYCLAGQGVRVAGRHFVQELEIESNRSLMPTCKQID